MALSVIEKMGGLDILINAAGNNTVISYDNCRVNL